MPQPEIIFGWDVSTACAAYAIFINGHFKKSDFILFKPEFTQLERWQLFEDWAQKCIKNGVIKYVDPEFTDNRDIIVQHCLEDRLMGFSKGFTNQGTLMKLGAMNATAELSLSRYILEEDESGWFGVINRVTKMVPVAVKSAVKLKVPKGGDKKEEAVRLVQAKLGKDVFPVERSKATKRSKGGKLIAGYGDMADATICAMALMNNLALQKALKGGSV